MANNPQVNQDGALGSPGAQDAALLIGRLLLAAMFLIAASNKFRAFDAVVPYFGRLGLPMPGIMLPAVIAFEAAMGLLLLIGYKIRWVALLSGLFVIAAGLIAHNNWADTNQANHFLKNMGAFGGCLALMAAGAGRYSIDGRRGG